MEIIGKGRTASVFRKEDKAVKIFEQDFPKEYILREYKYAKLASDYTPYAPKVFDFIEEKAYGIEFEYIEGKTMSDLLKEDSSEVEKYAKLLAELHTEIHHIELDFSDKEEFFDWRIPRTPFLSIKQKTDILEYTNSLEHTNHLCHGDFHPGNIIIGEKNYVIDWMVGSSSNPLSDVCRTSLMLQSPLLWHHPNKEISKEIQMIIEKLHQTYIKHYCQLQGVNIIDINEWMLPIAALRLQEGIELEKEWLIELIEELLSKIETN